MTKEDFADYLRGLREHDYDGFTRYYTSDIKMNIPGGPPRDREAIVARERMLADVWDCTLDAEQIVLDESGIAVRFVTTGPFLKDVSDLFGAAPKAGERWRLDAAMFYTLRDGKIAELNPSPASFTRQS